MLQHRMHHWLRVVPPEENITQSPAPFLTASIGLCDARVLHFLYFNYYYSILSRHRDKVCGLTHNGSPETTEAQRPRQKRGVESRQAE